MNGDRLLVAPDLDYVERASNHAKYGECSERPVMEVTLPSVHDDTLAPAGKHVASLCTRLRLVRFRLKKP